jgi:hypothetical protein
MDEDELVARIRAELNDFIECEVDKRIAMRFQNWDAHMIDYISRYVSETFNAYLDKVTAKNKAKAKKVFNAFLEDY